MKLLDYNKVLQDFRYKPNFTYHAYERDGRGSDSWWIRIVMLVEDSRKPFRRWEVKKEYRRDEYDFFADFDYGRPHLPPTPMIYSPSREMIEVMGSYPIPKCFFEGDDQEFISWMVHTIRMMEEHETDEWLRYKGELINDPHKE